MTFNADINEPQENKHPKGFTIAMLLSKRLNIYGIRTKEPENYNDIAWSVDCELNSKRFFFFVGYLGTKGTKWQLVICSGGGILRRLLGYNDDQERFQVARSIHNILSREDIVSEIKWFSKFTGSPHDKWFSEPPRIDYK
jgi:hypothetical protein